MPTLPSMQAVRVPPPIDCRFIVSNAHTFGSEVRGNHTYLRKDDVVRIIREQCAHVETADAADTLRTLADTLEGINR